MRAVNHHEAVVRMHALGHGLDGVLDAEDVRHVGGRDDLGARSDLRVQLLLADYAVLVGEQVHEARARRAARLLPGDEVRVVLHDGDAYLVAGLQHGGSERFRHEVQGLAGVAAEHDLARIGGADEARDVGAGLVDGLGGVHRQAIKAAQGVRVHLLVEAALRVEGDGRALGRGCAVEEGEAGVGRQQGEVLLVGVRGYVDCEGVAFGDAPGDARVGRSRAALLPDVAFRPCGWGAHATASSISMPRAAARRATDARVRWSGALMAASSKEAVMNRRSASSGEIPRLAR